MWINELRYRTRTRDAGHVVHHVTGHVVHHVTGHVMADVCARPVDLVILAAFEPPMVCPALLSNS